jgi:CelD/BcsL family acetyltransferase involved in cellulose biosynthesis
MTLVEITSAACLEQLRAEWESLWEAAPDAGPFQHPDWLIPWWSHLGAGELRTLGVREGGRLTALAPLYTYKPPDTRRRQIALLGNGVSDTLNVIASQDREPLRKIISRLLETSDWDDCDFRDLPMSSPLLVDWSSHPRELSEDTPCAVLEIGGAQRHVDSSISRNLLASLRYSLRRAEALGPVRIERAIPENLTTMLESLFGLHESRWSARGESGVLSRQAVQSFHCEVAARFLMRGWLRLFLLHIGPRTAAVSYGFHVRGRSYFYIGGFDPTFARYSPGSLLLWHVIRSAADEGAREFDFLRGSETYKRRWGARERPQIRMQIRRQLTAAETS